MANEKISRYQLLSKVLEVYIQRSANGLFSRCDACIDEVEGKWIEETDFHVQNCRVIPLFGVQWDWVWFGVGLFWFNNQNTVQRDY